MHDQTPTTSTLWMHFREALRRFLATRLPDKADADDVLQEVFLRIHEGASRLAQVEHVEAWLYAIARRAVADFYRTRGRRLTVASGLFEEGDEPADTDAAPSDNLSPYRGQHDVHEEVLSWLIPLIDDLPEHYRLPLRLADVEGRSQREVADTLGLSLSGAKSRVQRARLLLGDLLRRCCRVEFGAEGRAVAFQRLRPAPGSCAAACCA